MDMSYIAVGEKQMTVNYKYQLRNIADLVSYLRLGYKVTGVRFGKVVSIRMTAP